MTISVGFVGMTHLGICSSVGAATRGAVVTCFDPDSELIERLTSGDFGINEPSLIEYADQYRENISFTCNETDLAHLDVVYLSIDVDTNDHGESDLTRVEQLIQSVSAVLSSKTVFVLLSQLPPGFTRQYSDSDRPLYYQVETLIFGRGLERAIHPERFIVGCASPEIPLPTQYQRFLDLFGCPVLPMRYESAELTKIAINCFLVAQLSTTNTLSEICEQVGADWREIAPALHLDGRIGPKAYLKPGLGFAGGNLERDLASVKRMSERYNTDACVMSAALHNSEHRKIALADLIRAGVPSAANENEIDDSSAQVAFLGLAYKENTHSTKNAPSIALLSVLAPLKVNAFDPVVDGDALGIINLKMCDNWRAAVRGVDCVVIMTPWPEFSEISLADLSKEMRGNFLIDPFGVFDDHSADSFGLSYFRLGAPLFESSK